VKHLTFKTEALDGSLMIGPSTWRSNTVYEDSVEVLSEDSCVELDRAQAVAAALHMIACALGEVAALDAERAIAPHMKVSKP